MGQNTKNNKPLESTWHAESKYVKIITKKYFSTYPRRLEDKRKTRVEWGEGCLRKAPRRVQLKIIQWQFVQQPILSDELKNPVFYKPAFLFIISLLCETNEI